MEKLAILGGHPVRRTMLPYGQQWIGEDDIEEVVKVLKNDFITQGPMIELFEQAIADYVGAKYAVSFSNGTAALHAACFAAGISEGDEVLTTPITFAASANCVLYRNAKPKFVDINNLTYNINTCLIEENISSRTKAIIAVDFTGQPVDIDPILQIAKKHNLVVIQDGAHSLGATYKGEKVGKLADMTMFSFHPVKHITTGEGGMIVTNSKDNMENLKLFRTHGITRNNISDFGPWYYEMVELGYNYRMTDMQAALGLSQLQKLDDFIEKRRGLVSLYSEAFAMEEGVILPYQLPYVNSSWHLYILRIDLKKFREGRRTIFEALRSENIGVNVHYIPVYYHPYYRQMGFQKGLCPIAENWYEEVITLPLFPKMLHSDAESVIEGVKKVLNYYRI
jgi:perosamine synthetase